MRIGKKILGFCIVFVIALMVYSGEAYASGSFSVSGGGTVASGATTTITVSASNCAGKFTISASGSGKVSTSSVFLDNSSSTITVTAPSSGSTTITVKASDVTDYDGKSVSGSKTVTVSVAVADTRSTNNSLSALSVSDGTLSPEFASGTTAYTVNVMDIDSITINATKADTAASVSGTGEKSLEPGLNEFNVVVTAENGSTKTYSVDVTLVESPTAYITYGDMEYGVVKNVEELITPDGFEEVTVNVDGEEVTAWTNNLLGMTILYLIDGDGNEDFYVYDETTEMISEFRPLGLLGRNIYIVDIEEAEQTRDGMVYELLTIEGNEIMGWSFEDEALSDYYVIYVMSDTGGMVNYLYCESDSAMILAPDMASVSSETYTTLIADLEASTESVSTLTATKNELNEEINLYQYILIGLGIAVIILMVVVIILAVKLKKKSRMIGADVSDDMLLEVNNEEEFEEEEFNEELNDGEFDEETVEDEVVEEYEKYEDLEEDVPTSVTKSERYEIFDEE